MYGTDIVPMKPREESFMSVIGDLKPSECVMVGNDATDDMSASILGIKTFLLTDNLINAKNVDISSYPQGGFKELFDYINNLD